MCVTKQTHSCHDEKNFSADEATAKLSAVYIKRNKKTSNSSKRIINSETSFSL